MARKRERIFSSVVAVLFIATAVGSAAYVIWQMHQDNQNSSANTATSANTNASVGKQMDNFTTVAQVDTLQTIDLKEGTGAAVKAGDTVTVDYTGAVAATGKIFQSSLDTGQPVSFGLDQVIEGWKNGIPGMKVGGTRRLLIPAAQAYGANPPSGSGIPANADLVFDVTLHKIGN